MSSQTIAIVVLVVLVVALGAALATALALRATPEGDGGLSLRIPVLGG